MVQWGAAGNLTEAHCETILAICNNIMPSAQEQLWKLKGALVQLSTERISVVVNALAARPKEAVDLASFVLSRRDKHDEYFALLLKTTSSNEAAKLINDWMVGYRKNLAKSGSENDGVRIKEYNAAQRHVEDLEIKLQKASLLELDPTLEEARQYQRTLKGQGFDHGEGNLYDRLGAVYKGGVARSDMGKWLPRARDWIAKLQMSPASVSWTKETLEELLWIRPAFERLGKSALVPVLRDEDPVRVWKKTVNLATWGHPERSFIKEYKCRFDTVAGPKEIWVHPTTFQQVAGKERAEDILTRALGGELPVVEQEASPCGDEETVARSLDPRPIGVRAWP